MGEILFRYEPDAANGEMKLKQFGGPIGFLTDAEFQDLERELAARCEFYRRQGKSAFKLRTREFIVECEAPNGSRQPRLTVRPLVANGKATERISWVTEFISELQRLANATGVDRRERHALQSAIEDLQSMTPGQSSMLATVLLGSYLLVSEQHYRSCDAPVASMYALASRGLRNQIATSSLDAPFHDPLLLELPNTSADAVHLNWLGKLLGPLIRTSEETHRNGT
jgi:hypothetical protein